MEDEGYTTPSYDSFAEEIPDRLHGHQLDDPIFAVTKQSIRAKLHGNRPLRSIAKRHALIIPRANWVTQIALRLPTSDFHLPNFERAVWRARRLDRPDDKLPFNEAPEYMPPVECLQDAYPSNDDDHREEEVIESHRQRMNFKDTFSGATHGGLLEKALEELRAHVFAPALTEAMKTAVEESEMGKIRKIVAFGDHGVLVWDQDTGYLRDREEIPSMPQKDCSDRAMMWSSLHLMREVLAAQGVMFEDTPIFVQDVGFRRAELSACEKGGLNVRCGAYGHQQGFVEIDRDTMVVLFRPHLNMLGLIMEIEDPAVVFVNEKLELPPMDVDFEAPGYWIEGVEDLEIPSGNIPLNYNKFFREYFEFPLCDIENVRYPIQSAGLQAASRFFVRKSE